MKLSVIIVSYRVKYYLEQCLDSVFRAMQNIDGDVYVVENNSQDDTVDYLRKRFPQVHYIENSDNVGFAKANNIALRIITSEYVLLLNPDTFISEDTLTKCISLLDANSNVGACGVRMLNQNGTFAYESRRGIPTPKTAFFHMTGLSKLFPYHPIIGHYHMRYLDEYKMGEIEILSGAFMFIRRQLLDNIGLLDETFFMYGEDIDLSYRLLQTGCKNYYLPTKILHYKGESTHKDTYRYVKIFYNAMYIFFRKHYGNQSWLLSVPIKMAIFLKGAGEFIRRKLLKLFIHPRTDSECLSRYKFALLVSDVNKKDVCALCENHSIHYIILDSPQEISKDGIQFIVFDVSLYSYHDILDCMDNLPSSRQRPNVATYSPVTGAIIAGSSIIRN